MIECYSINRYENLWKVHSATLTNCLSDYVMLVLFGMEKLLWGPDILNNIYYWFGLVWFELLNDGVEEASKINRSPPSCGEIKTVLSEE